MMALLRHAVRDLRSQMLAYGLGLVLWGVAEALLFPSVRDTLGAVDYPPEILEAFGASGGNLADPRTFMDVEFFSLGPLVIATFALLAGSGALGGEESAGTMEVLASLPLSRRRMFVAKVGAVLIAMALTCALISIGWLLAAPFGDFGRDLSVARLAAATFGILPFAAFMVASSCCWRRSRHQEGRREPGRAWCSWRRT
ncbi:MAG: ABC transporter permease subunit [Dehalococcoidia bacterium]